MPSIVSPSRSVTIAFFQFARRPTVFPTRRILPRWFDVHTPVTFTPNNCSIAWRIAGFVASGATSKTYSPRSWRATDVFSVTIGRTMVRYRVDMAYRSFFLGAAFLGAAFLAAAFLAARLVAGLFAAAFFFAGAFPSALAAFLAAFFAVFLLAAFRGSAFGALTFVFKAAGRTERVETGVAERDSRGATSGSSAIGVSV